MPRHNPERVQTWRDLIDAWKRSGQTINAFCRARNLTRSNFDRWRRILARDPSASPHPLAEHSSLFHSSRTHSNLVVHKRGTKKQQEPPPRDGSMYCSYACATHSSLLFRGLDLEIQRPGGELRVALDHAVVRD